MMALDLIRLTQGRAFTESLKTTTQLQTSDKDAHTHAMAHTNFTGIAKQGVAFS